ncbi:7-carboxy-7-deazaguanine synthase QueE [Vibrio mangrovi]|uniref:7-carboxy-7-deazaguanine synthase n=1 Tax=Vibrio mangrovi TaxID=474394 RepID=A0ABU4I819_9VIBR|nr:7-carboxy-7-deazaguanine synthase QueE [Vibrio mangrovi]MDW6004093.1 7-carboxy-7-deazaguanine synthase QueE [Vibrio mangrovi]
MYKVNEIFQTIQGEGVFTGVPAVFIRLQGCPVGCSWCDTKQTWLTEPKDKRSVEEIIVKTQDSPHWCQMNTEEIIRCYHQQGYTARHIVITGGEPCIYHLTELTKAFEELGCRCQIETSGTAEVQVSEQTWVTVSPKVAMKGRLPVLGSAMLRANEIKHPVGTRKDIEQLEQLLRQNQVSDDTIIALQPISQKPRATELCIEVCTERNWRLSIQTHKYLSIA